MRLFTGIPIPDHVSEHLARLLDHLRPLAQIRWVPVYNIHLTTKFIGEWPEERLDELKVSLEKIGDRQPFDVSVRGIGWLPNPHSPRVLFTGMESGPELAGLVADTEDALARLGVAREQRQFRPHLTLARIKDPSTSLGPLRRAIASLDATDFGAFTVRSFSLYLSKLGPSGSIYTQLAEIPLIR